MVKGSLEDLYSNGNYLNISRKDVDIYLYICYNMGTNKERIPGRGYRRKGYIMNREFKSINIEISYETRSKNAKITVERKAQVDFGTETNFEQIAKFLEDAKKVVQGYKYCAKSGTFCKVYLSSVIYDCGEGLERLKSRSFNGWKFEGNPMDGDADGLYLSADLRYTPEEHDIYIDFSEPLLSQLAGAHI